MQEAGRKEKAILRKKMSEQKDEEKIGGMQGPEMNYHGKIRMQAAEAGNHKPTFAKSGQVNMCGQAIACEVSLRHNNTWSALSV